METIRGQFAFSNDRFVEAEAFHFVLRKDNVYEVIRIIENIPLFLDEHMDRMEDSLKLLHLSSPITKEELRVLMADLCRKNGISEGNIKLLINGEERPVLYLYFIPHSYPNATLYQTGIVTKTLALERSNPNAKVVRQSYKEKVTSFILENGIYEALLINRDNEVTEGSRSNVFFVIAGSLYTPPLKDVLGGVTRKRILSIAENLSIPVKESPVLANDLKNIEAAFISGTSPKILPISSIDEIVLDSSRHPMVLKLMDAYDKKINEYIENCK